MAYDWMWHVIDMDLGSDFFFNHHQSTDSKGKANQNKLTKQKQDYLKQKGEENAFKRNQTKHQYMSLLLGRRMHYQAVGDLWVCCCLLG